MRWQSFWGVIVQLLDRKNVGLAKRVRNKEQPLGTLDSIVSATALSLCTERYFCSYGE